MKRAERGIAAIVLWAAVHHLAGCGGEEPRASSSGRKAGAVKAEGVILAVGDSLTAGLGVGERDAWPALVEERLAKEGYRWKVINAGISGETSSGAGSRIDWVLSLDPDIVILETGANDGLRGIPPQVVRKNIDSVLATLGEREVVTILAGMKMVWNLGEEYTTEFGRIYPELADRHGVALIPFFLEGVAGIPSMNQGDGIHPSEAGHRKIARIVYPYILDAIGEVRRLEDTGTIPSR